jgi:hypothetical protein
MADWRQIQARIRKAKNSTDPSAKLSELYQRTRDGMVAWELGAVEEKNGRSEEAVKWYQVAAEKFRRADWKKKAEEALARLGVETPEKRGAEEKESESVIMAAEENAAYSEPKARMPLALGEIPEEADEAESEQEQPASEMAGAAAESTADGAKKKRRRGRRGGRGRRRKGGVGATPGLPAQAFASGNSSAPTPTVTSAQPAPQAIAAAAPAPERVPYEAPKRETQRPAPSRAEPVHALPQLPSERAAHGRSDPALSSRMSHLESLLRRLMQSPLHRLGEAEEAPAGPGVFVLSDSDQTSSYYIEACQTLRVGVGNLVRGVRSQKGSRGRNFTETNLKERFAEYLGINEAKVSQYMKDHCVVRWIQLDDEAAHLAHFAIGILRTPLNED